MSGQLDMFALLDEPETIVAHPAHRPGKTAAIEAHAAATGATVIGPDCAEDAPIGEQIPQDSMMTALGWARYDTKLALALVRFSRAVEVEGHGDLISREMGKRTNWQAVARLVNGVLRGVESDRPAMTLEGVEEALTGIGRYLRARPKEETR